MSSRHPLHVRKAEVFGILRSLHTDKERMGYIMHNMTKEEKLEWVETEQGDKEWEITSDIMRKRIHDAVAFVLPQLGYDCLGEGEGERQERIRTWRDMTETDIPDPGKHVLDNWADGEYWIHASNDLEQKRFNLLLQQCGVEIDKEASETEWYREIGIVMVTLTLKATDWRIRRPYRMRIGFGKSKHNANTIDWDSFVKERERAWRRQRRHHGANKSKR